MSKHLQQQLDGDEPVWTRRFDFLLPKEEIARRIIALQKDMSTPWTWKRISREIGGKIHYSIIQRAMVGRIAMTLKTQTILSKFLQDIDSGKLQVYYENPNAVRYQWGTPTPGIPPLDKSLPADHPDVIERKRLILAARKERAMNNRVIVKKNQVPQQRIIKEMKVSIGAGASPKSKTGPKLTTSQRVVAAPDMPAFSDVFKNR